MKKLALLGAALALLAISCSGDEEAATLPINDGTEPPVDAACLIEEPECDDTPGDAEPQDLPPPHDEEPLSTVAVGDTDGLTGEVGVTGFFFETGDGIRLCEALDESLPPLCNGASITVTDRDQVDPDDLRVEGSVTWTDTAVTIYGELIDGNLVSTPLG